ncbi:MAG: hypothetical protein MUC96_04370 [Myxococcaceae bacterium]|jgi:hypothetical protein|nr:hypothetical protein [Myxococcaceae bacterium]
MSVERVDKQWKTKGLSGYSTAAIFGTLGHYGITVDEAGFKALAAGQYPLQIAGDWKRSWKGTGPFLPFPYAAADELMRRFFPDRVTPAHLAEKIVMLLGRASDVLHGKQADLEANFAELEPLIASLPAPGETRTLFTSELVSFLDRFATAFEQLPSGLQRAGHAALASRAATLQESLFPDRKGVVTALLEAEAGARDAGIDKLRGLVASGEGRSIFTRYWALDALSQLDADDALKAHGLSLFDDAAKENRWPLADSVIHLMARLLERSATLKADAAFTNEVVSRFEEAHRRVGHHGH